MKGSMGERGQLLRKELATEKTCGRLCSECLAACVVQGVLWRDTHCLEGQPRGEEQRGRAENTHKNRETETERQTRHTYKYRETETETDGQTPLKLGREVEKGCMKYQF